MLIQHLWTSAIIFVAAGLLWWLQRSYFRHYPHKGSLPFYLLRVIAQLSILCAGVVALALNWGMPKEGLRYIGHYFLDGFTVSGVRIVPAHIVVAIIILALLLRLVEFSTRRLDSFLGMFSLDSGARYSLVILSKYVSITLSLLIGIGLAGVPLEKLTLIASALSVGIGFGLQTMVNNFVSGIILIFERPIKVGDWIKVGSAEGYVQRISIRYTLILTFDRTEVFVPNSEIISGQVTNWMHSNSVVRLMLPFTVEHNANLDRVKELLVAVAQRHPDVMQDDPSIIPPSALILDVNTNGIVVYLRVYLRDCNLMFNVQTDLRAGVMESLLAEGIPVARQQQDIRILNSQLEPLRLTDAEAGNKA
ncbi:mechanosensitive ion channel [Acidithiobacillus sp. YTS05]|uniref:mechanosensitive ion channel family protein n=1 Tax=Igneacidithiobacillus copahuensis TaxID=2724909 RepID=UPI001D031C87|nr:mechanosensitive ion channel domain-containing protein [Igneacidithiobacillus copahuensis]UTV81198.1 mechanosensitive ion channel [Acidithiobacillus sp. YTS05]